ncbi:response regulator [Desulfonatronum parangueonense]
MITSLSKKGGDGGPSRQQRSILLVDDDPAFLLVHKKILASAGYRVFPCATGNQGLEIIRRERPDLAVLDIELPDITGLDLCKAIKADPGTANIRILFLSGKKTRPEDRVAGLKAGADGYLLKPVDKEELLAQTESILRIRQTEDVLRASEARYKTIVSSMSDMIFIVDREDRLVGFYGRSRDVLTSPANFLGKTISEVMPPYIATLYRSCAEQVRQTGNNLRYEYSLPVQKGVQWFVASLDLHEDGQTIVANVRNITERKMAEEYGRQESAVNLALAEIAKYLTLPGTSVADIAMEVQQHALRLTGSEHGIVASIDEKTRDMVSHTLTSMMNEADCQIRDKRIVFPREKHGYPCLWGHALNTMTPFFSNDPSSHPASTGLPQGHIPVRRFISVPAIYEGRLYGQVALANSQRDYTENDLKILSSMAHLFAIAVNRKRSEDALHASEKRYRMIVETANEGIRLLDAEGKITFVNKKLSEMLGYSPDELLGRPVIETIHPDEWKDFHHQFNLRRIGSSAEYERRHVHKDGRTIWTRISATPVFDVQGECTGSFAMISDITGMKLAEAELIQAREKAEAASRAKSEFLANMSHEIRTPMNGVIGMTGLLLDTDLTQEQRRYAETIQSSGEALLNLINDILDFSKIEAGRMSMEILDFDLQNLVDDVAANMALRAHEKGLEFISTVDLDVPTLLRGDPSRLRQILGNLIGNAVKFTESGEIEVRVQRVEKGNAGMLECWNAGIDQEKGNAGMLECWNAGIADSPHNPANPVEQSGAPKSINPGAHSSEHAAHSRTPASQHPSIPASQHLNIPESQHLNIPASQHLNIPASQHPSISTSQNPSIPASQHSNIPASQHPSIPASQHPSIPASPHPRIPEIILRFTIRDTGIGIPEDKIGLLFDKFSQVDASVTRKFGGTGLGLAISRQLTEMMNGEMGVHSTPGQGSLFWFTARFALQETMDSPAPKAAMSLAGLHVLVVDDNHTNLEILQKQFSAWNMRPLGVAGGEEALLAAAEAHERGDPFEMAVVDFQMPGMDGGDLGRRLKDDPRFQAIPLVILTSLGRPGDARLFAELGFAAYLNKPIRQSELYDTLTLVLADTLQPSPSRPIITRHLARETQRLAVYPRFTGRVLVAEDNPVNQQVALGMLKKFGLRADAVANGREVLHVLRTVPYDLVLMDVMMPEMDGLEATRRIRIQESGVGIQESEVKEQGPDPQLPELISEPSPSPQVSGFIHHPSPHTSRRLPIIAMTAGAMQQDRERCFEAGMDDYVAKPVNPENLVQVLEKWLGNKEIDESGSESRVATTVEQTEAGEAQSLFDRPALLARCMNDEDLVRDVLKVFLDNMPQRFQELRAALKAADPSAARLLTHTIKGASGNVGAEAMHTLAEKMEDAARAGNLEAVRELMGDLEERFERMKEAVSF